MSAKQKPKKNKMKTHRGAAKRFKRTGTGKIKRYKCGSNHFTGKLSQKRIRDRRKAALVDKSDAKRINQMIPR